jgi:tetratricopeptide (TPR) repeat protein
MALTDFSGIVRNLTQSAGERAVARALQHFSKGQIDRAVATLKEAQQKTPDDPVLLLELGRFLAHAQKPLEAADAFRSLLKRDAQALQRIGEAIEELKAHHVAVGPLYDAVAEHHVHRDHLGTALQALEHMRPEDLRTVMPRYHSKYEQVRRGAANGKLTRTILLPAYQLALIHETLKEPDKALAIYRDIARTNPDEAARILPRLEAIAARDYQNVGLRLEVAGMLLQAGRGEDAARQYGVALESNPGAARAVADALAARLEAAADDAPALRFVLVAALLAAGDDRKGLDAMQPLVAAAYRLEDLIGLLQPLTSREKSGPAQRLLAQAFIKRGHPLQALGPLLQAAEEEGLGAILAPLQDLAEAHPEIARVHQLLADIHLEAGRGHEAIAALRRSRDTAPQDSAILATRLTRALLLDPSSPDAHLMQADHLLAASDLERAVVVLRHLLRVAPDQAEETLARLAPLAQGGAAPRAVLGASEACYVLGRHEEALSRLEPLVGAHPGLSAEFLHLLGALTEAAPPLAPRLVALFEALEPRSPLPVAVHFARAMAQFRAGHLAAAAASLREVLQSGPERTGEVREALERFDRADPAAAEARYLLASIYVDQRDHEGAMRELRRPGPTHASLLERVLKRYEALVRQEPQELQARCGLMEALVLAHQCDRVLEVGRETLRLRDDATTARVSLLMGDALLEKGDADGAVRRYYTAFKRDPGLGAPVLERLKRLAETEGRHPFTSLVYGKVLAQTGRADEALQALRQARAGDPALHDSVILEIEGLVRLCPADPKPGLTLLTLLQEAGQHARTVQVISSHLDAHPASAARVAAHLDEILKAQPDHPLAHYELGRALLVLSAHGRAADRFAHAARLDPALAPMALRRIQEILNADPACAPAWRASADVLEARGQAQQAAERLAEAIARVPQEAAAFVDRLEGLSAAHPDDGVMSRLLAEACVRLGLHERAAAAWGELSRGDLDMTAIALAGLDAALEAKPALAEARLLRARARLRMSQGDGALADFREAAQKEPRLVPEILAEVEALAESRPDWPEGTLLLADLLILLDRASDAERALAPLARAATTKAMRLQSLLRLARCAASRNDSGRAAAFLREAAALAPDRNEFLRRAHDLHLGLLRRRLATLSAQLEAGQGTAADLEEAAAAATDLGRLDDAQGLIESAGRRLLDEESRRRLHGALALARGDYPRAADLLRGLGPSESLACGALRAGDYPLAIETLEALAARDADPRTRRILECTYRDMVAADLLGGSRRLAAETLPPFGEGVAA